MFKTKDYKWLQKKTAKKCKLPQRVVHKMCKKYFKKTDIKQFKITSKRYTMTQNDYKET